MQGDLIEAEHLNRYHWSTAAVAGKRVLDAGCGTADGSALLMRAGAREVVGIDVAQSVLEAARSQMPQGVTLEHGDVRDLGYPDASFEVITCFEVIEHLESPESVIAELARVLAPGGLLVVSSPSREVDLRRVLEERFPSVRLWRQHNWLTSAILGEEGHAVSGAVELEGLRTHKIARADPGRERCALAVATNGELPAIEDVAVMTHDAEPRRWAALWAEQRDAIEDRDRRLVELRSTDEERRLLQRQLVEAEALNADLPDVKVARERAEELQARLHHAEHVIDAFNQSLSWRITAPLRANKRQWLRRLARR